MGMMAACSPGTFRSYDYCLKFLLVGDSDVGKDEILGLLDDEEAETSFCSLQTISPKTTVILLEGKTVKLQLWDTSGQGRFSTIIRSYSRGAQGVLVVYDITNHWSFDGITRWLKEIDEQAPGVPKILIGNRLHLEFRRQVSREEAEHFAKKKNMEYFEVSTLALFNIRESLTELSRLVMSRNGMERLWKNCKVLSLQELCCRSIVPSLKTVHDIDRLPLPFRLQLQIKSYADSAQLTGANTLRRCHNGQHKRSGSDFVTGKRSGLSSNSFINPSFFNKFTNRRRRATVTLPEQSSNDQQRSSADVGHRSSQDVVGQQRYSKDVVVGSGRPAAKEIQPENRDDRIMSLDNNANNNNDSARASNIGPVQQQQQSSRIQRLQSTAEPRGRRQGCKVM